MVYWNRPLPSNKIYKDNISILVNTIKTIWEKYYIQILEKYY
jgi:hypothetical protein